MIVARSGRVDCANQLKEPTTLRKRDSSAACWFGDRGVEVILSTGKPEQYGVFKVFIESG